MDTGSKVQPRPLTPDPLAEVPEPFRGPTLTDHHPYNLVQLHEEERQLLCPLCGVPTIYSVTHRGGTLHRAQESAAVARGAILRLPTIDEQSLQRTLAVVKHFRPALLPPPRQRMSQSTSKTTMNRF
ncbi:hypothetical protein IscW_ISCW015327 [Ixodes scapularis]|uniref:Uncharacterized protein n=1 Tax=Ixodes scapularis TaxID=6945 RepID=B7QMV5_IXOSC|nr:hypothetical protein IscW_ISCW015327 [Ixodes scapularis]|eukprot:XP_002400293.1 hypothetical protein IscW_ISCW015327 [Ixodes scapularis]